MKSLPLTTPHFDEEEVTLLRQCLESRWVTQGPFVRKFEELVAARHQVSHALATTSCTAALHLSTLALDLKPGDEVVIPAFTWVTSANCAEYVGAKAVLADVELETFNLDPKAFEAAITPRTRAVVVVHLFGLAARMHEVLAIARRHGLKVIEDAACAIGTTYDGRPVGGLGDLGCFSFHPRKVITTGEGGAVTTNDSTLAERVALIRNHGTGGHPGPAAPARPWVMGKFDLLGYNLRMSDIQAAVGVAQMAKLERLLAERGGRAARYGALLAEVPDLALPRASARAGHTFQSYVIRIVEGGTTRRNLVMEALAADGIQTRPGTHAVHRLGIYKQKYGFKPEQFPNAVAAEDTTITLPIFPNMADADQDRVIASLRRALGERPRA